jgi:hypothetical protein
MFKEVYYWIYRDFKTIKTNTQPFFNAYIVLSLVVCTNILSLVAIANYYTSYKYEPPKEGAIFFALGLYVIVTLVNYFILFNNKNKIVEEYDRYDLKRQRKGKWLSWLYIILSFAVFFYVLTHYVNPKY